MALKSLKERFEEKYIPEPNSGCWLWIGATTPSGYGKIYDKGKYHYTHRVSYAMNFGKVDDKSYVCHKCDNPSCVNPEHLFQGSPKDNTSDMVKKKRHAHGEMISKLKESDVINIYNSKLTHQELGDIYKVKASTVTKIKKGYRWKHLNLRGDNCGLV